jgi:threo-3-hydroxy-L-aspartate ammonia-lyase
MVVEPTGALAFAALFHRKIKTGKQRVGIIVSGGNVDLHWAATQVNQP